MIFWTVHVPWIVLSHLVLSDRIVEKFIGAYFKAEDIHRINLFGCWDATSESSFSKRYYLIGLNWTVVLNKRFPSIDIMK